MKIRFFLCASVAAVALSACDNEMGTSTFDATAGHQITSGFGAATANNVAMQNIQLQREMANNLTRIFASQVPATINFAFNSAQLDASAQTALRRQAAWIKAHPAITFRVFGHTDKVGGNAYNQRLGARRARAAVNYLISLGVDRKKIEAVVSYGETRPLVLTQGESLQNRRTVTEVKGFFNPHGAGPLDGKFAVNIYKEYTGTTTELGSASVGSG